MIRHIFKVIWNERKANGWIFLEYVIVFCILWFCVDYLCYMGRYYIEPIGYDIDYTYCIQMGKKEIASDSAEEQTLTEENRYTYATTFMERVKRHPDVENVSLSHGGMPFGFSQWSNSFYINADSIKEGVIMKAVTTSFFDVFKLKTSGRLFNWEDQAEEHQILISPQRTGLFGQYPNAKYLLTEVHTLQSHWDNEEPPLEVIGTVNKVKDTMFEPIQSTLFRPLTREQLNLADLQNVVRIKPGAEKDFEKRFTRDMRSQLNIGPFFLVSVSSLNDMKRNALEVMETGKDLNGVYAITAFLMINVFLALIGTFWYRTQARRSEVGLRIALGATKRKVQILMLLETLLLLLVASLVGVNICLNIGQTEFLELIGVPVANRIEVGAGIEQDFINFFLTFLFLAVVSLVAVWYPAKQASNVAPAEALREE